MANTKKTDETVERVTYLGLIGLFSSLFAAFEMVRRDREERAVGPFDMLMLGVAVYRMGRLIAYDRVTEPLRAVFTRTEPHPSGADMMVVARGRGVRKALGELLSCPSCAGMWAAALLVYGLGLAPRPTRTLLAIVGASGTAELINAAVEALTWQSQAERQIAGELQEK
ncbi:MAG TPA: DUF1360 domain-containing protein [Roseiflexaceae bacterium]|nr:DUF1360 domain-containing protein [Roseiflexaceae bacterium]